MIYLTNTNIHVTHGPFGRSSYDTFGSQINSLWLTIWISYHSDSDVRFKHQLDATNQIDK